MEILIEGVRLASCTVAVELTTAASPPAIATTSATTAASAFALDYG